MKRFLSMLLLGGAIATLPFAADAKKISADEALGRIGSSRNVPAKVKGAAAMQLRHSVKAARSAEEAVYVFAKGNAGYVVTPADDEFPAVLGYSDSGTFDADNLPPALEYWLGEYAAQIEYARENGYQSSGEESDAASEMTPIEPMLTCNWNQSEPFNNYCPTTTATGTKLSVTGCVATALAQVMYYHKWPAKGTGSKTWTYTRDEGTKNTLSMDFSEVTFDWDNMLDKYTTGNYTDEQADAVAKLMQACGIAVEATYKVSSTSANTVKDVVALCEYFGYSKNIHYYYRDYIRSSSEWENLVYDGLKNGSPVIYSGQSASGGHSFVCDGYAGDRYFHINWGWAGTSDGYFILNLLNPSDQGIGGTGAGYNESQLIICDIKPAKEGDPSDYVQTPHFLGTGDFTFGTYVNPTSGAKTENVFFYMKDGVCSGNYNRSPYPIDIYAGVLIYDLDGKLLHEVYNGLKNYTYNYGYGNCSRPIPNLPEGEYLVYPGYKPKGYDEPIKTPVPNGYSDHLILKVDASGNKTYSSPVPDKGDYPQMLASSFIYGGKVYKGEAHNFTMTFANLSDQKDYYGNIYLVVENEAGETVEKIAYRQNVPYGASMNLVAAIEFNLEPGKYNVRFENHIGDELIGNYPLVISEGSANNFTEQDLRFVTLVFNTAEPGKSIVTKLTLKNVTDNPIPAPKLGRYFFQSGGTSSINGWSTTGTKAIPAGSTMSYTHTSAVLMPAVGDETRAPIQPGEYYMYYSWYKPAKDAEGNYETTPGTSKVRITPYIYFTIAYPIESITLDKDSHEMNIGQQTSLVHTILPAEAHATSKVNWHTSDAAIAEVDENGVITAKAEGEAKIFAVAPDGKFATARVKVNTPTSVEEMLAGNVEIIAVYTLDGTQLLANPTADAVKALDKGIYMVKTVRGTVKYVK